MPTLVGGDGVLPVRRQNHVDRQTTDVLNRQRLRSNVPARREARGVVLGAPGAGDCQEAEGEQRGFAHESLLPIEVLERAAFSSEPRRIASGSFPLPQATAILAGPANLKCCAAMTTPAHSVNPLKTRKKSRTTIQKPRPLRNQ